MSQILAFSLDCSSSPSILLKMPELYIRNTSQSYGRGFAWYNHEELSATIVKETKYAAQSTLINTMQDFSRFHSTIFIGHIRGAAKRLVQKDTQPFSRSYAGRDWIFVHSGDLLPNYAAHIPLEKNAFFEPIGSTDSEHSFCYILEKLKNSNARSFADVDWAELYFWLVDINKLGTANIIMSDGMDVIIYHDAHSFNPLYWLRSCPPHVITHFDTNIFTIDLTIPFDIHHTFVLITNEKINQQFTLLEPSQMLVLRRGQIIWNSLEQADLLQKRLLISQPKPIETPLIIKAETALEPETSQFPDKIIALHPVVDAVASTPRKIYSVYHETIYRYDHPVDLSKHLFHLHPTTDHIQAVLDYKLNLSVDGHGEFFEDVFGNMATFYNINSSYSELIIRSESIVCMVDNPSHQSELLHQRRDIPLVWLPWQRQMMSPYLLPPELPESDLVELIDFAMSFVKRNDYDLMEILKDINQTIYRDFNYVPGETSLATTPYELYMTRQGVCQDFTNLFICLARLLNVPARYRTGYIYTATDYDNKIQSEASHAWVEVYLPNIGWYGFDPTNGCVADKNHIRVACGRNYFDATPTTGTIYKGGGHEELMIIVKIKAMDDYHIKNFA